MFFNELYKVLSSFSGISLSSASKFPLAISFEKDMNWVIFAQLVMTLVGSISAGCLAKRYVLYYNRSLNK